MINEQFKTQKCLGCYRPIETGIYHEKCSKNLFGTRVPPQLDSTVSEVETYAQEFLKKRLTITGVQRKLSLYLGGAGTANHMTIVGTLGGNYVMKPQSSDYQQMPENEDLCMHLAGICGIKTAKHGLIPMKDQTLAYVTKRFDRKAKTKIAVEDLCQLSELQTEQKYRASHEKTGKVIRQFSSIPGDDILRYFELILFSYITGNNDMHLKNFSLITDDPERIVLSPAYDLISVRLLLSKSEDPEELALAVNGKKNRLMKKDFDRLAINLNIPTRSMENTYHRFLRKKNELIEFVHLSFLDSHHKKNLTIIIEDNLEKIS